MGSFKQLLMMLPGIPKELREAQIDEGKLDRINAIITSMTPYERRNPKVLNASRRKRIAQGSGNKVEDINRFMTQFEQMQKMMKQMMNKKGLGKFNMPNNFKF